VDIAASMGRAVHLGGDQEPVEVVLAALSGVTGSPADIPVEEELDELPELENGLVATPPEIATSSWDPSGPWQQIEASRCRALLLEVLRRAAHDWILYRGHTKLQLRQLAEDAYVWLFEERPSKDVTSFLTICELLDLDPKYVRNRVRSLTVKQIMTAGRPAEQRKIKKAESTSYVEHPTQVDVTPLEPSEVQFSSSYEAYFSVGK
jgi:hypothetical protein